MNDQADDQALATAKFQAGRDLMIEKFDYEGALPYLLEAFTADKTNDHYAYVIAECYYFLRNYTKALTYIGTTLHLNEDNCIALALKSIVLEEIGERDRAKAALEEALTMNERETCDHLFLLA